MSFAAPGVEVWTPLVWEVLFGESEYDRSLHVMIGTIVSIRGSTDAAANWICPPYEPPTMPTRGSLVETFPA